MIYDDLSALIGKTPIVKLTNICQEEKIDVQLLAKLEYFNPSGSIKDRTAYYLIEDAKKNGSLKKDTVLIEATSGNTGISLALLSSINNYQLLLVMPDTMSIERQKLLRAYGAKLVLTNGEDGMLGAVKKAQELNKEYSNSLLLNQFDNLSNRDGHYRITGKEIYEETGGNIDILIAGIGTGGTITGVAKYLKSKIKNIKIIGVEPEDAIPGIGAGFIPKNLEKNIIDQIFKIKYQEAKKRVKQLAKSGILVGPSSGAVLEVAIKISNEKGNNNKKILLIFPDTGQRYLSTDLFD